MEERTRENCDLVMKGGIASGVVYPGAVEELAKRYRFRNLGGTSAGAIAAAVAAAGEYGRQRSGSEDLPGLAQAKAELSEPGFIRSVLAPEPSARPAFELMIGVRERKKKPVRAAWFSTRLLTRAAKGPPLVALALAIVLIALAVTSLDAPDNAGAVVLAVLAALVAAALLAVLAVGGSAALVARRLVRTLQANGFGICGGAELTDWLHRKIQACAGRGEDDPPLTFRDLQREDVNLAMVTTDLSYARPVVLPMEEGRYLVERQDVAGLFPEPVVRALCGEGDGCTRLPGLDMPIVVGVRLSLSFPLLLSAVRLRSRHPKRPDELIDSWLSDGGISSNFPIHFFDSWLPGHPTFGLDLQPFDEAEEGAPDVFMPSRPDEPLYPHWTGVTGIKQFVRQVSDVMENWRDTMQTELPGFRDRVCQVRIKEGEGGMNVGMDDRAITRLIERGREAAREIERKFDMRNHRFTRYLTLMQLMELKLHDAAERFEPLAADLLAGMPDVPVYREGHDEAWCRAAERATARLLDVASEWGPPPAELGFDRGVEPTPRPALRITPEV